MERNIAITWKDPVREVTVDSMAVILSEMPRVVVSLARNAPVVIIDTKYSKVAKIMYIARLVRKMSLPGSGGTDLFKLSFASMFTFSVKIP